MVDRLSDRRHAGRAPVSSGAGPRSARRPAARRPEPAGRPPRQADRARAGQERYERGARRTGAEPLEAAWRPDPGERDGGVGAKRLPGRKAPKSGLAKLVSTYGWRVYALPVLLVLTLIVVVDTGGSDTPLDIDRASPAAGSSAPSEAEKSPTPEATEKPAEQVDLKIPTATLPAGGAYTKRGKGDWNVVDGEGKIIGKDGTLYKYTVEVEKGIDSSSYGGDEAFAALVDGTLSDPRGWTGGGKVRLKRVDDPDEASFRVSLTTPGTNHKPDVCGYSIKYESSCYRRSLDRVVINLARWVRGAKAFSADMLSYRQYAINHEVGHALGNGHVGCSRDGGLAPVMMQQSFGVANDYVAKLNKADPKNYTAVPRDGKVCKPNAWPNPSAR